MKRRTWIFVLLACCGACVIAVVAAEIVVRITQPYVTLEMLQRQSLRYEAVAYARHALQRQERVVVTKDGEPAFRINRHGYRGRDLSLAKPEGVVRIVFLGGSSVFDLFATAGQDWPNQVGRILRTSGLRSIEVMNAGIPGHSSADSVGRLFTELHRFEPDYVILCNAWNDIKSFQNAEPLLRWQRPYIPGESTVHDYRGPVDRVLSHSSQLYIRLRHRSIMRALGAVGIIGPEGLFGPRSELVDTVEPSAVAQYRLNVQLFIDACRNTGACPIVMTQVRLASESSTPTDKKLIAYQYVGLTHGGLVNAFGVTDEVLRTAARDKNAHLIDAGPAMTGRSEYFRDSVHLSEAGSAELARLTADALRKIITESRQSAQSFR